jgi:hypothetical protein
MRFTEGAEPYFTAKVPIEGSKPEPSWNHDGESQSITAKIAGVIIKGVVKG